MQLRGLTIPAVVSHFFAFMLGTLVLIPFEGACDLDFEGILVPTKGLLARQVAREPVGEPLYLITKQHHQKCRVSDQPFTVRRSPGGDGQWLHLENSPGSVALLQSLMARRTHQISRSGAIYPLCQGEAQVVYGF